METVTRTITNTNSNNAATVTTVITVGPPRTVILRRHFGFVRTPIGMLMVLELTALMLAWSLLGTCGNCFAPQLGFAVFGFIANWVGTLALFIIFIGGFYGGFCSNAPWGTIQVQANIVFVILSFTSASCVAAAAVATANPILSGKLAASCAFGYIGTVLYGTSAVLCFQKVHGRFPWKSSIGQPHILLDAQEAGAAQKCSI